MLEQNLPRLLAFVRLRGPPLILQHESCGDVVQSVCREVLENLDGIEYRGDAGFRSWLFTAALRKINQRTRHLTRKKRDVRRNVRLRQTGSGSNNGLDLEGLYSEALSPVLGAVASETLERFESAFAELSEDDQEIFILSRIMGFSHAEIAERTPGDTSGAVRTRLHRALARLGRLMDRRAPD